MTKCLLSIVAVACAFAGLYLLFPNTVFRCALQIERHRAGLKENAADVASDHLVYLEGGGGEPLVLLHGFSADKDSWLQVSRYLTPHFRVIVPDLPGFGESTKDPMANYGYLQQIKRLRAFITALALGPVHLAGNSMGGQIAGIWAARHPDEVRSLWLLAPGGVMGSAPSELVNLLDEGKNPLLVDSAEAYDQVLSFLFVRPPYIPWAVKQRLVADAIAQREFNEKVFRDLHANFLTLEPELRGSKVPTLIAWGDRDRLLDVSGARILGSLMAHAEVDIMRDVGHCPMIERPEASAIRFLRFRGIQS